MPEGIQNQEQVKQPEKSILPVSREAVDEALAEISYAPQEALVEEQALMERQNPFLAGDINTFAGKLDKANYWDYLEGAHWTYRILRKQAEMCGRQLPQISHTQLSTLYRNHIQRSNEEEQNKRKEPVLLSEKFKKIAGQDREFLRAMGEFTKYSVAPLAFYLGVTDVYKPIKDALNIAELTRMFNV